MMKFKKGLKSYKRKMNTKRLKRYTFKGGNNEKTAIVGVLSNRAGFFSVFSFILRAYLFAKERNIPFFIDHKKWQYTYKDGWHDYFKTLTYYDKTMHFDKIQRYDSHNIDDMSVPIYTIKEYIKAIKEIFILTDSLQERVDSYIKGMNSNYLSLYVRRGDKINDGALIPLDKILEQTTIKNDGSTIFIQTDDYSVVNYFKSKLPSCKIMSLTEQTATGANNLEMIHWTPEHIKKETEQLLISCVITARANKGWSFYDTNVGSFIKLLGYDRISIYVDDKYKKKDIYEIYELNHKGHIGDCRKCEKQ